METATKKHQHWMFMQMKITLSYCMRMNFALDKGKPFLGLQAVDLIRPRPEITNMISYHKYICAN